MVTPAPAEYIAHHLAMADVERAEAACHRARAVAANRDPLLTPEQRAAAVLVQASYATACGIRAIRREQNAADLAQRMATRKTDPAPAVSP